VTSVPRPGLLTTLNFASLPYSTSSRSCTFFHADASAGTFERRGWPVSHADAIVGHLDVHAVAFKAAAQRDRAAVDARSKPCLMLFSISG